MPELPDVENYRRYLDATALHKTVADVEVGDRRILRGVAGTRLRRALRGRRLDRTRRHGKHLLVALDDGGWLTLHFGMTGSLKYFKRLEEDPAHDRLRLDFENGYHLAYEDQRLLGEVGLADDADAFIAAHKLGPDAMDPALDADAFVSRMLGRKGQVKAALMDQALLAGIGNVYSDEILFRARIHPKTQVQDVGEDGLRALHRAMRTVLEVSIERGAGAEGLEDRLPSTYLLPHRRDGARCPRCGGEVKTLKAAGRTAYYCPACQPPGG